MQTKLLRVLEDGEVRPVGSERARSVDVRVIGATHRDLEAMVRGGHLPRGPVLPAERDQRPRAAAARAAERRAAPRSTFRREARARRKLRVSEAALEALAAFAWPGNVRQLENEIRRALVLADEQIDVGAHSRAAGRQRRGAGAGTDSTCGSASTRSRPSSCAWRSIARQGNQTRAANSSGSRAFGLQKMMKRLRIADRPRALRQESRALRGRS